MALRFHWRLLQGGESDQLTRTKQFAHLASAVPDLDAQVAFCQHAEAAGIDSVLVDLNSGKPEPMMLAAALATATKNIHFLIAVRSGLLSPTLFVQQVNTFSALYNGRIKLNIVAGHSPAEQRQYGDWLSHVERYQRTTEFLAISHAFWHNQGPVDFTGRYFAVEGGIVNTPFVSPTDTSSTSPEIFIAGNSSAARDLASQYGSCWMRLADSPQNLRPHIQPVLDAGKQVGLRLSLIVRPSRDEALRAAAALVENLGQDTHHEQSFVQSSDSVSINATYALAQTEWLTPYLWTGAVRAYGGPALALVGTPQEVAAGILEFQSIGVSQFIFSGWPRLDEMRIFGREVLPLIRQQEQVHTLHPEPLHQPATQQL